MKDITISSHLQKIPAGSRPELGKSSAAGFVDTLKSAVTQVNDNLTSADRAVEKLQTGESRSIHEVMISMEKADISLRLMVQVRNKVIEAYRGRLGELESREIDYLDSYRIFDLEICVEEIETPNVQTE